MQHKSSNVYIKKDGITSKLEENSMVGKAFLAYKVDAMDMLKGVKDVKISNPVVTNIKKMFDAMKKDGIDIYKDTINKLAIKIVNLKSLDELIINEDSIFNTIMASYIHERRRCCISRAYYDSCLNEVERTTDHLRKSDDISVMSSVIKDIMRRYVRLQVDRYSEDELINVYKSIINGDDPLKYIKIEGIPFSELSDETLKVLVQKLVIPTINNRYNESVHHLCFDCKVNILDCPKILDQTKKNISQYDFITDGKQVTHIEKVINRYPGPDMVMIEERILEEIVDEFTVTKCKKFKK